MSDNFTEKELVNATVYYLSNDAIFMGLKENFTDLETIGINSESTEDDYASAVLENNNIDETLDFITNKCTK